MKGDTVQIVRNNGKIHDYVLDGERVEPHETLSLEKVSDIIKELADELGVSKTYIYINHTSNQYSFRTT
ncbi:hypothetical protein HCY80_11285 [Limosilactobacillus fermentum]